MEGFAVEDFRYTQKHFYFSSLYSLSFFLPVWFDSFFAVSEGMDDMYIFLVIQLCAYVHFNFDLVIAIVLQKLISV